MFFGETTINLDAKGRLAIPMRYRDTLKEQCNNRMVLTYHAFESGSLWLQSEEEWQRMRKDVMALTNRKQSNRSLQRRLVGSASTIELDSSGRILLPSSLREGASLEKKVILLGMDYRFEIWNENILNTKRAEEISALSEQDSEDLDSLVL